MSGNKLGTGAWGWLAAFVLYDFAWYVNHRMGHRVGVLWAMHHVHHSCPQYNMTVASRGFVADNSLLLHPVFYLLPIFGLSPLHFVTVKIVTNIWGIAQHTGLVGRLGVIDRWIATPSSHRVHHGSQPQYLDKNYGEVLMIWDRIFGTYEPEVELPKYGVVDPVETANPLKIQVAGFRWLASKLRRMPGRCDRVCCLRCRRDGNRGRSAPRRLRSAIKPDIRHEAIYTRDVHVVGAALVAVDPAGAGAGDAVDGLAEHGAVFVDGAERAAGRA